MVGVTTAALSDYGIPQSHHDLLTRPLVGTLTTIGPDGLPQSTAVWFLFDDHPATAHYRSP